MTNETIEVKVDAQEVAYLQMSLALLITMLGSDMEEWQNKKDSSMDKMFMLMETKLGVMNLWRKVLITAGADPEELARHIIESGDNENG
jgi:hypothetical protein